MQGSRLQELCTQGPGESRSEARWGGLRGARQNAPLSLPLSEGSHVCAPHARLPCGPTGCQARGDSREAPTARSTLPHASFGPASTTVHPPGCCAAGLRQPHGLLRPGAQPDRLSPRPEGSIPEAAGPGTAPARGKERGRSLATDGPWLRVEQRPPARGTAGRAGRALLPHGGAAGGGGGHGGSQGGGGGEAPATPGPAAPHPPPPHAPHRLRLPPPTRKRARPARATRRRGQTKWQHRRPLRMSAAAPRPPPPPLRP